MTYASWAKDSNMYSIDWDGIQVPVHGSFRGISHASPTQVSPLLRLFLSAHGQGMTPSKVVGVFILVCFNDDGGLWLSLPQPCDSHRPSLEEFSDGRGATDVRIAKIGAGKRLSLYDSVRKGLGSMVSDRLLGFYWFRRSPRAGASHINIPT
jgi:hypothetical protein